MAESIPGEFKKFLAEAEARDPEGFARARAEQAEMEALRKDAERYRRLRNANPAVLLAVAWGNSKAACAIGADCDAAIDAWAAEAGGSVSA